MGHSLKAIFQSIGFRLLASLLVTVGAVLSIYAVMSFRSTKEDFLGFVRADIERSSGLIKRATHDGMLLNRKEEMQAIIERLAQGPEIAAIRVYDKDGTIAMSAHSEEIGLRIDPDSDTCLSCHEDKPPKDIALLERRSLTRTGDGPEVLRHLSVIENEPSCAKQGCHAHPEVQRVLGILDLEMSMAPLDAAIHTAEMQFLWTALVLSLIVGVVVAVFIRRVVQRPVLQLCQGTRRIADGDLDTRIEVRGHHELAQLAEAFNRMAADLSAARREVTEWSQKLEEKVVQKTEELGRAQRQVLHMDKMASLGKLSATVAHELNNPLTGMLTYTRLVRRELAEQPLDPAVREQWDQDLTVVERECCRCAAIVQDLLLFARRSGARMAPTDLNQVVERGLTIVRHHIESCGATLRSELLSGDSQLVADAAELQQAVVALLVNAVEAMSGPASGDRVLTVRLRADHREMQIEVCDTGAGIPPDVLPQIFDPFFSTKEKGVGLGLAVVYGIVQRHGGQVEVESKLGEGTVFRVRLPRQTAVQEDGPPLPDRRGPAGRPNNISS